MSHKHPLLWFARAAGVCLVRPLLRKFTCIPLPFYIRQTAFFLSPTGNLLPVVAITMYVSDSPLFPVAGKVGKRAVFDIRRKGNPKTIGFWWKLPKRRLRQIQRGGFEEVSRFSRHNVAGNRLTRRCVLSKRRLWRIQRGGFEEVSRFSRRASGWKSADTTVCAFAHFSSCWEKWAVGGTVPTKEKHPSERKRKPAKRERIPTTSLRTGLGMTGLAYERIFSGPIKSTLPCTVSLRGNRRSAACGG